VGGSILGESAFQNVVEIFQGQNMENLEEFISDFY
jgi:hypothetical protein